MTSSTDVNTNQISQTDTVSNQIYPTDVGLGTNIINKRFSLVNYFFLLPQLPHWRRDRSLPIRASTKYLQQTSSIKQYPSFYDHLARQTPRLCPTSPNRHRGPTDHLQSTPRLDEFLSTDTRAFEPGAVTPPNLSEIFTVSVPPTRSFEDFSIIIVH